MEPIVHGLEQQYVAQIAFERIDANTELGRKLLRQYGLRGHPSYAIVDAQSNLLWSGAGVLDQSVLQKAIIEHSPSF